MRHLIQRAARDTTTVLASIIVILVGLTVTACGSDSIVTTSPPEPVVPGAPQSPALPAAPAIPAAPAVPAVPNFVRLASDPADYIGGGRSYSYTQADAVIVLSETTGLLNVSINGDEFWSLQWMSPNREPFRPGTYANLTRYPFHIIAVGGLSVDGEGRGCSSLTGSVTVDSVTYVSGKLTALDMRFEQRCDGRSAALRGTIHWRIGDATGPAGPVNPIPANLWKPDPAFTPASGNFVFLASDPGDVIGQGIFKAYTPATSNIVLKATGSRISVSVDSPLGWMGEFEIMLGTLPIKVGYYGDVRRFPFHNPAKGGLSWTGMGRGCNRNSGWFVVDRLVYSGTILTAIDMRFEQRCEMLVPALRGAIRWTA